MNRFWQRVCLGTLLAAGLAGCASNPEQSHTAAAPEKAAAAKQETALKAPAEKGQPVPQKIQLKAPGSEDLPAGTPPQIIQKDLFNIEVSKAGIVVNGTEVANLKALEALLAAYPKPMVTLAAHKCLSNEKASEVLSLAQDHTDVPIAFGSYGSYDDPECG